MGQSSSLNLKRTTGSQASGGHCCEYLATRTLLLSHYTDTLTTSSDLVLSMPLAEVNQAYLLRDIKLLLLVRKHLFISTESLFHVF